LANMFIQKLTIKNLKCFADESEAMEFNVPDGKTEGSGLNIFVGENGTGKTATLEAINFLTESHFAIQNKLKIFDFHKDTSEINVEAIFNQSFNYKMPETYRGQFFECNGLIFSASQRDRKSPGKLLSPALSISARVLNVDQNYKNSEGKQGKAVEEYHKMFDVSKLDKDELNIFYFDKYRTRHITSGTFTTTFDRIIDDLNWKFVKGLKDNQENKNAVMKLANDYFAKMIEVAQKGTGEKISQETKAFFNREDFEKIKMDFINILWPFSDAFFALREENEANQIPVAKLGSGIEMIFTLLLLRSISSQSKGSIIYLIDEPEISLHPQAQKKLFQLLLQESKDKQVFISTHSSYFTEPNFIKNISRFQKTKENKIIVHKLKDDTLAGELKENRNFFFRHRDLFFTDAAIFLEGVEDYDRYSKFCEGNNFSGLLGNFYMMNGCDPTLFFEKFCGKFGIKYFAVVDKDFSINRSKWHRENRKKFIADLKQFIKDKEINFDESKFDQELKKELKETPRTDDREAEEIDLDKVKILKVKGKNIFVLKQGEVKDYLDKDGNVVSEGKSDKIKELKAIFGYIAKDFPTHHPI
jgi:AAA15 family ATPase/GTPase